MSKYAQCAAPNMVLSDGVLTDATAECNRLYEDNLKKTKLLDQLRQRTALCKLEVTAMHNQLNPRINPGK